MELRSRRPLALPIRISTHMAATLLFAAYVLSPTYALQVTPNSPCSSLCVDNASMDASDPNSSNTFGSDIVCRDGDYSSAVGTKFEQCLNCLQNSTATQSGENDQMWYFYNLRYAFNTCIFGIANATDPISTPCSVDPVCAPLERSMVYGMQQPLDMGQYDYCGTYDSSFLGTALPFCESCLRISNGDTYYLSNFLVALNAGCNQRPASGMVVGINSTTIFTTEPIAITFAHTPKSTTHKNKKSLKQSDIIGIAVAAAVIVIVATTAMFVCIKKRRNETKLRQLRSPLDERFGAENISAPHAGAYSSPQVSPPIQKESVQMTPAPKVRSFSSARNSSTSKQPIGAREWTGATPCAKDPFGQTQYTAGSDTYAASPPGYSNYSTSPPSNGRQELVDKLPTHHAYIPPEYTPPSRNSTSPIYVSSPSAPSPQGNPATHPQRSPSSARLPQRSPSVNEIVGVQQRSSPVLGGRVPSQRSPPLSGSHRIPPSLSSIRSHSTTPAQYSPPVPINRSASVADSRSLNSNHRYTNSRTRDLTAGRHNISVPMITVGTRFEDGAEEYARRNRERLYREGVGGTMGHGPETRDEHRRGSPASESSDEQWPGSY